MKARVKATGDILEIASYATIPMEYCDSYGNPLSFSFDEVEILSEKIESNVPDYWTRLEHQYAGMAMQAMLTSPELMQVVTSAKELLTNDYAKRVAVVAARYANALVEELKEKEERK